MWPRPWTERPFSELSSGHRAGVGRRGERRVRGVRGVKGVGESGRELPDCRADVRLDGGERNQARARGSPRSVDGIGEGGGRGGDGAGQGADGIAARLWGVFEGVGPCDCLELPGETAHGGRVEKPDQLLRRGGRDGRHGVAEECDGHRGDAYVVGGRRSCLQLGEAGQDGVGRWRRLG